MFRLSVQTRQERLHKIKTVEDYYIDGKRIPVAAIAKRVGILH